MNIQVSFVARLDNTVTKILIEKMDFRIGSGNKEECDVQLPNKQISRCHAILRRDPEDKHYLIVEDVSENGCLVNSRLIHQSKVRTPIQYSVLQIGEYLFWFSHPHTIPNVRNYGQLLKDLQGGTGPTGGSNQEGDLCNPTDLTRYLLRLILPHEDSFHEFCIDHCEKVAMQFGSNMSRANKEKLLLAGVEPDRILELLHSTDATIEQRSILRCVREHWQRHRDLLD